MTTLRQIAKEVVDAADGVAMANYNGKDTLAALTRAWDAIDALRTALAESEQCSNRSCAPGYCYCAERTEPEQQLQWCKCGDGYPPPEFDADGSCPNCVAGMTAGNSTEPEQEPVAWMNVWGDLLRHHPAEYGRNDEHEGWKPLYTHPAPDDTALLRQALEALEASIAITMAKINLRNAAITALRERLSDGQ
jgi:hypothetical protein